MIIYIYIYIYIYILNIYTDKASVKNAKYFFYKFAFNTIFFQYIKWLSNLSFKFQIILTF